MNDRGSTAFDYLRLRACRGELAEGGFTLLEVLVALSLTVLALSLAAMSLTSALTAYERAAAHLELIQTERETLSHIQRSLSVSYLSPYSFTGLEEEWETFDIDNSAKPYDALTFSSLAHRTHRVDAKESDLAVMTLFVRREEESEGLEKRYVLLKREGGAMNDRFEVTGGVVFTLAEGVTRLSFDYLSPDGEVVHEWRLVDKGRQLPCAVVVKLGLKNEALEERRSCMVVPLLLSPLKCSFEEGTLDSLCEE